jgi:hypothetical protein
MNKKPVFQFKITLLEIEPLIWRRIQISDQSTFWDLHVAIQDAMGWKDCHLHEFTLPISPSKNKYVGIPDPDGEDIHPVIPGWSLKVSDHYKSTTNQRIFYLYDFGDSWRHLIEFEGEYEKIAEKYPRCLSGQRACPPEDVGSIQGYEEFLSAIKDPNHEDHERLLTWIGGKYDPEEFSADQVKFTNANVRLKRLLAYPR